MSHLIGNVLFLKTNNRKGRKKWRKFFCSLEILTQRVKSSYFCLARFFFLTISFLTTLLFDCHHLVRKLCSNSSPFAIEKCVHFKVVVLTERGRLLDAKKQQDQVLHLSIFLSHCLFNNQSSIFIRHKSEWKRKVDGREKWVNNHSTITRSTFWGEFLNLLLSTNKSTEHKNSRYHDKKLIPK